MRKFIFIFIFALISISLACTEDLVVDDVGASNDTADDDSAPPAKDTDKKPEVCAGGTDSTLQSTLLEFIVVVDSSAGMEDEVLMVQTRLPLLYSELTQRGIDMHLTVIAAPSPSADDKVKSGICLDAPLGSGNCPGDTLLPRYRHIEQNIGSKDALTTLMNNADIWNPAIRPDSQVHFMVVSDDNADMDAAAFQNSLATLTPPLTAYYFHSISASLDKAAACNATPANICCETAAKAGEVYRVLSEQTGGIFHDLCDQDFNRAFEDVASFISKSICQSDTTPDVAQPE